VRFIHTADLHFGGSKILPRFLERQESAFDQVFDVAYDQDISTVVIAGDLFDEADPSPETRDLVERKLLEYDAAGFTILLIPGNHDVVNRSGYTALHYLSLLYDHGCLRNSVFTERTKYVQVEGTVFCLLVHPRGGFSESCRKAVVDYHESGVKVDSDNLVMVAHETIRGSQTDIKLKSGDYYRLEGGAERPDSSLDVTYWALGDIHKAQSVGPRAFYSGAPLQIKFGDDWPKGVLVVDTEDPDNPMFADIETNQLVKALPGEEVPVNSYVKLKVKSKTDLLSEKSPNVVRWEVDSKKVALTLDVSSTLKDKLIEGVKQQGAEGEVLEFALEEIESLLLSEADSV
jgi:DNA repair exonuclease SbcCD nuclease subunit